MRGGREKGEFPVEGVEGVCVYPKEGGRKEGSMDENTKRGGE